LGGGKERKASQQMQADIARKQLDVGKEQLGMAKTQMDQRTALQKPSVDFYTKILSGDPTARMTAAAPLMGEVSRGARAAKEQIYDSVPHGAARNAALAQVPRDTNAKSAEALNNVYMGAFPALSSLGTESGQVGLQQTGAGFRGVEGSATTNNSVIDAQQKQKAATLGMIGSLAGVAGSAASGFKMPSFLSRSSGVSNPIAQFGATGSSR